MAGKPENQNIFNPLERKRKTIINRRVCCEIFFLLSAKFFRQITDETKYMVQLYQGIAGD